MFRRSWDDEKVPGARPTPPPKTIYPDTEKHYERGVKEKKNSGQKRRKSSSSGVRNFFITLLVLGGCYFGAGALVQNIGDVSWQRKAKEYSIFVWPRVFTMSEEGYDDNNSFYQKLHSTPQSSSRPSYSEDNPTPGRSSVSQERDEYEGMKEESERAGKEMVEEAKGLTEIIVEQLPLPIQRKNARKQIDKGFKKLEEMYDE